MPENQPNKESYIEYKSARFPIKEGFTRDDVAKSMAVHFPELSNFELIAKKDDPLGFVIQPQSGKKG